MAELFAGEGPPDQAPEFVPESSISMTAIHLGTES